MTDITKRYVTQVVDMKTGDLPDSVIRETRRALLDTIGCMVAGVRSPIGKSALEALGGMGGAPEATVIGDGRKLPAPIAAYIDGQCCVGPDLSDNYKPGSIIISHPGEGVIPPVLALAEKVDATVEDLILATVAGYETAGRYAHAIEPRRPEVYSFTTHYGVAGGIACAKLLGFGVSKTANLLGIAGTLSPLPVTMPMWGFRKDERPASWHRDMPGHANFAVVTAALFSDTDFRATNRLLDEQVEYYKIAGSDNYNPELLFDEWGKRFVIEKISYKSIPSCYFNQPCIEAVRLCFEENGIELEEVEKIDLYAPSQLAKNFMYYPPRTPVDTASSVRYLTAMYLLTRKPGTDWYLEYECHLADEDYKKIADRIAVYEDEGLQKILEKDEIIFGKAVVKTKKGSFEKQVDVVHGADQNPFTKKEIEDKFITLSEPVIGKEKAEAAVRAVCDSGLDHRVKDIVSLLCP
ncbi:MAG: MmgE/PrpD family protein [Spirochaetes bacterium]|nr:MmgE/PrpD family protein [Spirochaetota bacterium]